MTDYTWTSGVTIMTTTTTTCNTLYPMMIQEQWLAEVTYKPGWSFRLMYNTTLTSGNYTPVYPGVNLIIEAHVTDSTTLASTVIIHTLPFPEAALWDRDTFFMAVLQLVTMVERHEAMEFLKASGVRVRNPHPSPTEVLYG
jgi:hypothetical protein